MADGTGVVFDRSRITHGEMKRVQLMQIEIRRAQESLDAEKAAALLDEMDRMVAKVVVALPDGWLPEGVTLDNPDWINQLSQEHYDVLIAVSQPVQPGEKKA